jgi:hypothetical protein
MTMFASCSLRIKLFHTGVLHVCEQCISSYHDNESEMSLSLLDDTYWLLSSLVHNGLIQTAMRSIRILLMKSVLLLLLFGILDRPPIILPPSILCFTPLCSSRPPHFFRTNQLTMFKDVWINTVEDTPCFFVDREEPLFFKQRRELHMKIPRLYLYGIPNKKSCCPPCTHNFILEEAFKHNSSSIQECSSLRQKRNHGMRFRVVPETLL